MGSQPSSNFLGIEAFLQLFFPNFHESICNMLCKSNIHRTSIRTQSKIFCKNKITSEILQPSTSKSLKDVVLSSPILQKNSALFVEKVFVVLGFFAQGVGVFVGGFRVARTRVPHDGPKDSNAGGCSREI
jgi:hypothetical protein